MQSFIVLGIIPGTDIQTTLNFWIYVSVVFALLVCRRPLNAARKQLRRRIAMRRIAHTIGRYEFSAAR